MTQAVSARRDGDTFQARIFWLKAARLLDEYGSVIRVGFESGPKGFDDVWVEYDPARAPLDQYGRPLHIERLQCKWHATHGTYGYSDLVNPEYINATTTSLLQRAYGAFTFDSSAGRHSRNALVTNHRPATEDVLHQLIRTKSYTLDVDRLFTGTTARSATGKARNVWREHLAIDDDALKPFVRTLGFNVVLDSLDGLRERMDEVFRANGLKRLEQGASASRYDDTVFQWAGQKRNGFDRDEFRAACKQEGLLADSPARPRVFGVKSFEHAYDRLEDRCDEVLNLVPEFDERFIRATSSWRSKLQPELQAFLSNAARSGSRIRLAVDAHTTLAFAAGAVLDTKSGRIVEVEQRSPTLQVWAPDDAKPDSSWPMWDFKVEVLNAQGTGTAVAVSLTRPVMDKVRAYLRTALPGTRQLILASPTSGPSQKVVRNGAHANQLAEDLVSRLKAERGSLAPADQGRMHLFMAAPNAFSLYLGRHVGALKPMTVYEFDFETQRDGSYRPSLMFPEVKSTGVQAMP